MIQQQKQSMFIQQAEIPFPAYTTVLQIEMAYNRTYLLLLQEYTAQRTNNQNSSRILLRHYTSKGQLITDVEIYDKKPEIVMINQSTVVITSPKYNLIDMVDLPNRSKKKLKFEFQNIDGSVQLYYFSKSNILAIKQNPPTIEFKDLYKTNIKLTYIRLPNNQKETTEIQIIDRYEFDNAKVQLTQRLTPFASKGNNQSAIIFKRYEKANLNTIMIVDLGLQGQRVTIRTRVVQIPGINSYNFYTCYFWLIDQDHLLVVPSHMNLDYKIQIIDFRNNSARKLKKKVTKQIINCQICFLQGYIWLRQLPSSINGVVIKKGLKQHLYSSAIDYNLQELASRIQQTNNFPKKHYVCSYDPGVVLEETYDTVRNTVMVKKMRPVDIRGLYMHILLHIEEDFDDDLLLDSMTLLCENI